MYNCTYKAITLSICYFRLWIPSPGNNIHWYIAILPNVMHSDGGSKLGSGDLSTPWQIIGRILFCLLVQLQLFIITILEIVGGHPVKTSLMSMRMTTDSPSMSVPSGWKLLEVVKVEKSGEEELMDSFHWQKNSSLWPLVKMHETTWSLKYFFRYECVDAS